MSKIDQAVLKYKQIRIIEHMTSLDCDLPHCSQFAACIVCRLLWYCWLSRGFHWVFQCWLWAVIMAQNIIVRRGSFVIVNMSIGVGT